jgi:HD-GYP domain-containing protein (c-di-GMP phosphodiesterase class II)
VEEIRRNAGIQFDPHLVEVFLEVVSDIQLQGGQKCR